MSITNLQEALKPLTETLRHISLDHPETAQKTIQSQVPFSGDQVQEIFQLSLKGVKEGWLLPKESGPIRFGRIAKDLNGFSVDAVLMKTPGPKHRHANGEIDLCFATKGEAKFDSHPQGWVIYGPDSIHTPTVTDGEMLILYFLPGGAIEFL